MGRDLNECLVPGKKVFFIGIGGVGMSALARVLSSFGLAVSGSDVKRGRRVSQLENDGILVVTSHQTNQVDRADWVIFSSAIREHNPELKRALALRTPTFHRAEVLAHIMNGAISIAVTGTHGKTTSSAFASFLLTQAGYRPTCLIGGEALNFGANVVLGDRHLYVAEVDESDRSHLRFSPDWALITNLEAEHLDVYQDLADIKDSFRKFMEQVKKTGKVVYGIDDLRLRETVAQLETLPGIVSFGLVPEADFSARDFELNGFSSSYTLCEGGKKIDRVHLNIPGLHNIVNSLGVIALLRAFGLRYDQFLKRTADFRGAGRRLEVKLASKDLTVIDDYAHHPTEVHASLKAIRELGKKMTAVFQPHRFSRTAYLAREFSDVFRAADRVILTDIYAAGEENPNQIGVSLIYDAVKGSGHPDVKILRKHEIIDFLVAHRQEDEVIAFLGAGDIGELADEFTSRFETAYSR